MDDKEKLRLATDAATRVQNVVSDFDHLEQASSELRSSLATLAQFLAETGLEELTPIDSSQLSEIADEVKQFADQLGQIVKVFKATKHYV